jgi:hypothetical protein
MNIRSDKPAALPASFALALALALALGGSSVAHAADQAATPGTTYASLSALPDWSGWWGLGPVPPASYASTPPPLKPEKASELARREAGKLVPGLYCRAPAFVGFNGSFVFNFEFLFTPGRVTITNELGLVRRIYTDGRPLPQDPTPSNAGTSVGHWEGQTLVIETTGLKPDTPLVLLGPIGRNVRITERIRLREKDILETEMVMVAPDLFSAPDRRTFLSGRVPGKQEALETTFCSEHDRSYDPVSGKERFDMTPPADLPPPPPQ